MGVPLLPRAPYEPLGLPDWSALTATSLSLAPDPALVRRILDHRHEAESRRVRLGWGLCQRVVSRLDNPSIAQFAHVTFPEFVEYHADLVARSQWYQQKMASARGAQRRPAAGRRAARDRRYNQLPCTVETLRYRVEEIGKLVAPDDPILVLGDDDLLSVALARAGFTDVTALDIDPRVIGQIRRLAREQGLRVRARVYDLRAGAPPAPGRGYRLVFFDPINTADGVCAFLGTAVSAAPDPQAIVFANLHLMSLFPRGLRALRRELERHGLQVRAFHAAVSAYPNSALARLGSWALARGTGLYLGDSAGLSGAALAIRYFVADGLVLARR